MRIKPYVTAAFAALTLVACDAGPPPTTAGGMKAGFLGEDAGATPTGNLPATFLGKDADKGRPDPGFQRLLHVSWGELNPFRIDAAHAEYDGTSGRTVGGQTAGIFGAADRAVDQTIASYRTGSIGRVVATFWRDLFTRGTLYNPSSPGNIPGLFLSGVPTMPGERIKASFLSGTVAGNVPTGFIVQNLNDSGWGGTGYGNWSHW